MICSRVTFSVWPELWVPSNLTPQENRHRVARFSFALTRTRCAECSVAGAWPGSLGVSVPMCDTLCQDSSGSNLGRACWFCGSLRRRLAVRNSEAAGAAPPPRDPWSCPWPVVRSDVYSCRVVSHADVICYYSLSYTRNFPAEGVTGQSFLAGWW